jgi:uncharacterized short protein YbdD (DUF466 family)
MLTPAILVDIDSTLAHVDDYLHHIVPDHPDNPKPGRKDYHAFHAGCDNAPLIRSTEDLIEAFEGRYALEHDGIWPMRIMTTARSAEHRDRTHRWLMKHGFGYEMMLMRGIDDYREDYLVKDDMVEYLRKQNFELVHAWDDSPKVIDMYEDRGVPVTEIPRTFSYRPARGEVVIA